MKVLSRSVYLLGIIDAIIIAFVAFLSFSYLANTYANLFIIVGFFLISILSMLGMKGFYKLRQYGWKDIYLLFEGIFLGAFIATTLSIPILGGFAFYLVLIDILLIFVGILFVRICFIAYKKIFKPIKNILILRSKQQNTHINQKTAILYGPPPFFLYTI